MKPNELKKTGDKPEERKGADIINLREGPQELPESWKPRGFQEPVRDDQEAKEELPPLGREERKFSAPTEQKVVPIPGGRKREQPQSVEESIRIVGAVLKEVRVLETDVAKAVIQLEQLLPEEESPHAETEMYGAARRIVKKFLEKAE